MPEIDQQIVQLMKSDAPPQTVGDLVKQLGDYQPAYVYSRLSAVLNAGLLTRDQLPWRRDQSERTKRGRPRKAAERKFEKQVQAWIDEGGKDRVGAAKLLMEFRQTGADVTGPPEPNDKEAVLTELSRQMAAVGKDWTFEALCRLWPDLHAILLPEATSVVDQAADTSEDEQASLQAARAADNGFALDPAEASDSSGRGVR